MPRMARRQEVRRPSRPSHRVRWRERSAERLESAHHRRGSGFSRPRPCSDIFVLIGAPVYRSKRRSGRHKPLIGRSLWGWPGCGERGGDGGGTVGNVGLLHARQRGQVAGCSERGGLPDRLTPAHGVPPPKVHGSPREAAPNTPSPKAPPTASPQTYPRARRRGEGLRGTSRGRRGSGGSDGGLRGGGIPARESAQREISGGRRCRGGRGSAGSGGRTPGLRRSPSRSSRPRRGPSCGRGRRRIPRPPRGSAG